jgi:site-specific recombinase XerD
MKITNLRILKRSKLKKDLLVSHTARRTFCTQALLRGTDIPVIMAISGHRDVKTFMSYVKVSAEVLAQQIKKNW